MTYAAADQIVEYDNPASDYVKQYENIPEKVYLLSQTRIRNRWKYGKKEEKFL